LGGRPRAPTGEFVGAAQRIGYAEAAGHELHQFCRLGAGHPGGGDEHLPLGIAPEHRYGVSGRTERGLGQADHREAELGVHVGAQAGSAARVQIGIAVDHQQSQRGNTRQDRAQRRQFPATYGYPVPAATAESARAADLGGRPRP
jgi:hypothetical protein